MNVTEQVPLASVQLVAENEPVTPLAEKLTVPVGVLVVPADASATVAVHVEAWLMTTGEVHEIVVVVCRRVTVTVVVPELVECVESPA